MAGSPQPGGMAQPPNIMQTSAGAYNAAVGGTGAGMGYQPMSVQAPTPYSAAMAQAPQQGLRPDMVQAGQIATTDLSQYMNPYENQVVGQSLQDLERARQMQANQLAAQATSAGAFGGSRQALMESELGRNYMDQAARTAGQLRQAGFQNAQQLAGQDIATRMQAGLANQAAGLTAGQFNLGQQMQAQLANQTAQNAASQFGAGQSLQASLANQMAGLAGAQQRLGAANQMGQLSNLGFGMGQNIQNQMMQQGNMQQLLNQQLINAGQQQYGGYTGAPAQSIDMLSRALGTSPQPSTTETTRQPGLFDYLTLGLS